jgi:hypothetical protein
MLPQHMAAGVFGRVPRGNRKIWDSLEKRGKNERFRNRGGGLNSGEFSYDTKAIAGAVRGSLVDRVVWPSAHISRSEDDGISRDGAGSLTILIHDGLWSTRIGSCGLRSTRRLATCHALRRRGGVLKELTHAGLTFTARRQ